MDPTDSFGKPQIEKWASRQLADYDAHNPGTLFAEDVVLNVAEGYELQSAVAQLRCRRGEQVIGYKVGCTSPKIRETLQIDHCVSGRLFDSERLATGALVARSNYANLAIEGELAVELSHVPTENDFSEVKIPACVARVIPVIELHNQVIRGAPPSVGELIANNAIHAGFVVGRGVHPKDAAGVPSLAIFADNRKLDECDGIMLIQTINASLKWLMEFLRDRGDRLGAGQIILTGSVPDLIPIREACRIRVDAPPFGSVEMNIV